jgi:Glycosyl hydrolase family 9/Cellulase N-terminal ig-like domain
LPAALLGQLRGDVDTRSLAIPGLGSSALRILSPTLLEISLVTDKASGTPPVPSFTAAVDGKPVTIVGNGAKRRVIYAPLAHRDLRIATCYYIELREPLQAALGKVPVVRVSCTEAGGTACDATTPFDPRRESPAVHVNQEGYATMLPKKALVGYYLGDLGEMDIPSSAGFQVVDARSGTTVFTGTLTRRRDFGYRTNPMPYQNVYEADFTALETPGEYRVWVPGLGTSIPFLIDEGIAMGLARTYALGLYGQRCGSSNDLPFTRFTHDACHGAPAQVPSGADPQFAFTWKTIARYASEANADNPAQTAPTLDGESSQLYPFVNKGPLDVSGGHHDAGDYSRYTINSAELIHYLVFSVDSIPGVAALDNLGIPESGDGIPDVLQEAKWEADFLAKLQDADGGFYFLVYPRDREYESNILPDHGEAQVVWPKNTASTAAAVAALAQCASSPEFKRHFPADAARYLAKARLGWKFLADAIAGHGKAGAYQKITFYGDHFTHDDELAWAACEMYLATGEDEFRQRLFEWFPNPTDHATFRWGWWRMSEGWGNAIRSYAFASRSGRMAQKNLDPQYLRLCEGQVLAAGDDALDWSRKNAYATPFPPATKAVNGAGWYFSVDQASDMAVAAAIDPKPGYIDALVGAMNYESGCNPVNVTFVTGLGRTRQREIVDQYAQNDRRVLPPTGIPIGNIQAAFQYMPDYGFDLRKASYPDDNAAVSPYPFYDRWSDAYNVTTEFIAVNQSRSLMVAAYLAGRSEAARKPWRGEGAVIVGPRKPLGVREPNTFTVEVPGMDLSRARIVWEARGQDPAFGPSYKISPKVNGHIWVEVEAEWPDGRRASGAASFSADSPKVAWVAGSVPTGGALHASGEAWSWTSSGTASHSGAPTHLSSSAKGLHEHWFTEAADTLSISAGDTLYAWVFLDAANPPTEIMLGWNDGSTWEHRAFWGSNAITYGRNGTPGRFHAGALPPSGQWVRLTVAASKLGLEGSSVSGMCFSLVDGQANWDEAGRLR